ncbi:MAG: hypothetical protein ACON31_06145 [Candidatus Puniceispirillaceae bacterium]
MPSEPPSSGFVPLLTGMLRRMRLASLTLAWIAAVAAIILDQPSGPVATTGAVGFGLFILLTVARLRWDSLVILTVLAAVTWLLVETMPGPADVLAGGERVLIFAALLPTMALVRATAMTMPSVHETQQRLGRLPPSAFSGGQQLAAHVFGGIINTGAFALLSAALPSDADTARRRISAEAVIRGMVSSSAWSPFFIAFAIGQNFVAPAYAWMAIGIGTVSALLFTFATLVMVNRDFAWGQLRLSLSCLRPVATRLLIVLLTVLGVALVFGLTALSAVVVVMPLLVAVQLLRHRGKAHVILRQTRDAMHSTADDLVVIAAAMLVAFFATQDDSLAALVGSIHTGQIPGWVALISTPVLMMLLSVVGIHPVITSTALLATFSGGGADVHPALLVQAHLIGWGAGTMSSMASLSVLTCAGLYRVPARHLVFGHNMASGFAYAAIGGVLLVLANIAMGRF